MMLTVLSLYLLGQKSKSGFLFGFGANLCWGIFGVMAGSVANVVANIIFFILNVRGWINWTREEKDSSSARSSS